MDMMNIFDNSYDITGINLIRRSFGSCNLYLEDSNGFYEELPEFERTESFCYYNSGGTTSTCSAVADGFASRFCPCSVDGPSSGPALAPSLTTVPIISPSLSSIFPALNPTTLLSRRIRNVQSSYTASNSSLSINQKNSVASEHYVAPPYQKSSICILEL